MGRSGALGGGGAFGSTSNRELSEFADRSRVPTSRRQRTVEAFAERHIVGDSPDRGAELYLHQQVRLFRSRHRYIAGCSGRNRFVYSLVFSVNGLPFQPNHSACLSQACSLLRPRVAPGARPGETIATRLGGAACALRRIRRNLFGWTHPCPFLRPI